LRRRLRAGGLAELKARMPAQSDLTRRLDYSGPDVLDER
jgi:hypothetical protein